MSGLILHHIEGWHSVFYFFGSLAFIWSAAFAVLASDTPATNSFISVAELEYLQKELAPVQCPSVRAPIPWRSILTSVPVWALTITTVGHLQVTGFL